MNRHGGDERADHFGRFVGSQETLRALYSDLGRRRPPSHHSPTRDQRLRLLDSSRRPQPCSWLAVHTVQLPNLAAVRPIRRCWQDVQSDTSFSIHILDGVLIDAC